MSVSQSDGPLTASTSRDHTTKGVRDKDLRGFGIRLVVAIERNGDGAIRRWCRANKT